MLEMWDRGRRRHAVLFDVRCELARRWRDAADSTAARRHEDLGDGDHRVRAVVRMRARRALVVADEVAVDVDKQEVLLFDLERIRRRIAAHLGDREDRLAGSTVRNLDQ